MAWNPMLPDCGCGGGSPAPATVVVSTPQTAGISLGVLLGFGLLLWFLSRKRK